MLLKEGAQMFMLPPTYLTCLEVGQHDDPAAVVGASRDRRVEMFTPEVEEGPDGMVLSVPDALMPLLEAHA